MTAEYSLSVNHRPIWNEQLAQTDYPTAADADNRVLTAAGLAKNWSLRGDTTPKVDVPAVQLDLTFATGSFTIDLTAAPVGINRTHDLTGKKLIYIGAAAPKENTGLVRIRGGASSPYHLFGTNAYVDLVKGDNLGQGMAEVASERPIVSATEKLIDLTAPVNDRLVLFMAFGE